MRANPDGESTECNPDGGKKEEDARRHQFKLAVASLKYARDVEAGVARQ